MPQLILCNNDLKIVKRYTLFQAFGTATKDRHLNEIQISFQAPQ